MKIRIAHCISVLIIISVCMSSLQTYSVLASQQEVSAEDIREGLSEIQESITIEEQYAAANAPVQASKSSQDPPYVGAATTFETGPANPRQPKTYYLDLNEENYPTKVSREDYGDYMQGVGILYPGDRLVIIPENDPNPGRDGTHGNPGKVLVEDGEWLDLVEGDRSGPLLISGSVKLGRAVEKNYVTEITVLDNPVLFNYSGSGNSKADGWAVQYEADYPDQGASFWTGSTMLWVSMPNYHPVQYTYSNKTQTNDYSSTPGEAFGSTAKMIFGGDNPTVIFAEDLSCNYNPIDGNKTTGPEFTIYHPQIKGYKFDSIHAANNSEQDCDYEPTRVSAGEDGTSSKWRFFFRGADDYRWSFDNRKHGSEEDPITFNLAYYEARTVSLNANGGKIDDQDESIYTMEYRTGRGYNNWYPDGGRFDLSKHIPVREGSIFTGWFADRQCRELVSAAGSDTMSTDFYHYINAHDIFQKDGEGNCAENFDLYAGWKDLNVKDIGKASVAGVSLSYGYSGKEYRPAMSVTLRGVKLRENTDYTVKYENNRNPGTATITLTGRGKYTGKRIKTFEIVNCASSIVSGRTYQLIPKNNSKTAVCSFSGKMVNNTKVYITDRSSSEAMKFKAVKNSDGSWKFINAKCELALAVQQNSREAGKGLVLYDQTAKPAQNWKLSKKSDNSFAITNAVTGFSIAMSDESARKGTALSMAETKSSGLQRFYIAETTAVSAPFDGTHAVRASKNINYALHIASSSREDGANVNLYAYSNTNAGKFKVIYSGGGYYRLVNLNSGLVLSVSGNTEADGANVIQSKWAAESGQRWKIAKNSNGTVTLTSALGTALHLTGNKTANGTNIIARNASASNAQNWYLR